MLFVDATCPLVSKVHIEAERHHGNGLQMVMIGHEGHPETVGTMGQLPDGEVLLVETVEDVAKITPRDPDKLAYITQTTLSVDDTADIVQALIDRFPSIVGPHKEDICYATTNRQAAVKAVAGKIDALFVIGAPNSSNSKRLVEVGHSAGCEYSQLIQRAHDIDWRAIDGITLGRANGRGQCARGLGERGDRRLPRAVQRHGRAGRNRSGSGGIQGAARSSGICLMADQETLGVYEKQAAGLCREVRRLGGEQAPSGLYRRPYRMVPRFWTLGAVPVLLRRPCAMRVLMSMPGMHRPKWRRIGQDQLGIEDRG